MISVNELRNKLPQDFIEEINSIYTTNYVDKILSGMTDKRLTTIRANTIKITIQELMNYLKENNIKYDRVLWYEDALIIKNANEKDLMKLEWFDQGKFYMQSLSSMVPALVLNPKPNETILDMTAAPGSKTSQIAMLMGNQGKIVANELDKLRFERLKYNIDKQGATIVESINYRGESLWKRYPETFDKILLDAPCSGEGRFIGTSPETYKNWYLKDVSKCSSLQKKLIKSAFLSLKRGGVLVYSTCTLNLAEDEEVLNYALDNFNLELMDIDLKISSSIKAKTDNNDIMIYNDSEYFYNKSIEKAIRIIPSKLMEGFFVAKLKKK